MAAQLSGVVTGGDKMAKDRRAIAAQLRGLVAGGVRT